MLLRLLGELKCSARLPEDRTSHEVNTSVDLGRAPASPPTTSAILHHLPTGSSSQPSFTKIDRCPRLGNTQTLKALWRATSSLMKKHPKHQCGAADDHAIQTTMVHSVTIWVRDRVIGNVPRRHILDQSRKHPALNVP